MEDRVLYWNGKVVSEMSRDELEEAFQQVCRLNRVATEMRRGVLDKWNMAINARRAAK